MNDEPTFRVEILALAPIPMKSGQWRWVWAVYASELTEDEAQELLKIVKKTGNVGRIVEEQAD